MSSMYVGSVERAFAEAACYAPDGTGTRDLADGKFSRLPAGEVAGRLRDLAVRYERCGMHQHARRVRREAADVMAEVAA